MTIAPPDKTHWDPTLSSDVEFLFPITVVHSGGSTGYAKPIIATASHHISPKPSSSAHWQGAHKSAHSSPSMPPSTSRTVNESTSSPRSPPSHSQLSTEAPVFLPYRTQIPRADKGSILRLKLYKEFEKVIEVYKRLEGEVGSEGKIRVKERRDYWRAIQRPIDGLEDDTDLFDFWFDSLQSTRIRNAIQRVCVFVSFSVVVDESLSFRR
jgi:hypothetical protein